MMTQRVPAHLNIIAGMKQWAPKVWSELKAEAKTCKFGIYNLLDSPRALGQAYVP